jgi:cysteinyl-tRNA synthetase
MARKFLGDHIDIHAGGMDLIFPHHENEIAQSEGLLGAPFAKYWMHNAFVRIDKQKMSKSLGNFFTLKEVFEKFNPMVVRYYYLNHNYNIPLDFSFEELEKTQKGYQRLAKIFALSVDQVTEEQIRKNSLVKNLTESLCDDLNSAQMVALLFENLEKLEQDKIFCAQVYAFLDQIVGLKMIPLEEKKVEITPAIQKLIDEREEARKAKDWAKSDKIRDQLKQMGVEVRDKTMK